MTDGRSAEASEAGYYDERWRCHEYAGPLKLARAAAILEQLAHLGLREPRIIELGCGAGWLTSILDCFGPALGVDISPEAINTARERYPHASFECVDLRRPWDLEGDFDVVVSHEVVEHLDDQAGHLAQAFGLLVPGGWLVLTTPNARVLEAMEPDTRASWSNQPIENWLRASELRHLAAGAGFEIVRSTTMILGQGQRPLYTLVNSGRVHRALESVGLAPAFDRARRSLGFGLHQLLVARRPFRPDAGRDG